MKKLFFALTCAAAVIFAGCQGKNLLPGGITGSSLTDAKIAQMDNKTEKCWHVVENTTTLGVDHKTEWYTWCTEREVAKDVKFYYDSHKFAVGETYEIAYKQADAKTENACDKLDRAVHNDDDPEPSYPPEPEDTDLHTGTVDVTKLSDSELANLNNSKYRCWYCRLSNGNELQEMYVWATEYAVAQDLLAAHNMYYQKGYYVTCTYELTDISSEYACDQADANLH